MSSASRNDPHLNFNFDFEVGGLVVGSFSEVSGLSAETEVEEYREGGVNDFIHKLPKVTKYGNIILKRGMTSSSALYNWYRDVSLGKIDRKQVTVTLFDSQKSPVKTWTFHNAFPIKWNGPDLKADSNTVAVESVEFVHQGLVWLF
jgi:phage tail-like protein